MTKKDMKKWSKTGQCLKPNRSCKKRLICIKKKKSRHFHGYKTLFEIQFLTYSNIAAAHECEFNFLL